MSAALAMADSPRSGRIGPREAAQLAAGARVAGVTRGSARVVLELLLRHTRGSIAFSRRMRWIAGNVGISQRTAIRAIHDLVAADIVRVPIPGTGHQVAHYLVNVDRLRVLVGADVTPPNLTIQGGEPADSVVTPGVSERHPRGDKLSPLGCQNVTPGVTERHPPTRAYTRAPGPLLPLYSKDSPTPPSPTAPPGLDPSPDVVGAPFKITGDVDAKCAHGRTVAQGGCRPCGTTARQLVNQHEQRSRLSRIEQQRRDQAARRDQETALQAAAKPAPESLRASIRAARAKP